MDSQASPLPPQQLDALSTPNEAPDEEGLNGVLIHEVQALRAEVERLNGHRFIRLHQSIWGLVGFHFARGLAFGLGTVVGATLLVSISVYLLSQIEIVPILGNWATAIIQEIEAGHRVPGQ